MALRLHSALAVMALALGLHADIASRLCPCLFAGYLDLEASMV